MRVKWLAMLVVVPMMALLSPEASQSIISAACKITSAIVLTFGITLHMIVATILWFVVVIKARRLGCDPTQGPYREGQKVLACARALVAGNGYGSTLAMPSDEAETRHIRRYGNGVVVGCWGNSLRQRG